MTRDLSGPGVASSHTPSPPLLRRLVHVRRAPPRVSAPRRHPTYSPLIRTNGSSERTNELRGGGVRFLRAQRSTCTENLLRRLIIIKQISDRNRQHIRSVSPSLAVLISAKDVPELWAGGAGISRAGQAGCCSRTCRNYGLVVLELTMASWWNVGRECVGIKSKRAEILVAPVLRY